MIRLIALKWLWQAGAKEVQDEARLGVKGDLLWTVQQI